MKSLFCMIEGKKHCLATREIVSPGLCIRVNDKTVNVITSTTAGGKTVIRSNGVNRKPFYRAPGLFIFRHHVNWTAGSGWDYDWRTITIENGLAHTEDLGNLTNSFAHYYFDRKSGYYYMYRSPTGGEPEIRYSYDGINWTSRQFSGGVLSTLAEDTDPYKANNYNTYDLRICEMISDGAGGFNLVFGLSGDRNNPYVNRNAVFAHSYHLQSITSELQKTNDFVYSDSNDHVPDIPQHYPDPEVYTVNGYTITTVGNNYKYSKTEGGVTTEYTLTTPHAVWDPVTEKYFFIKFGPDYTSGNHEYADLNLYTSTSLNESNFTLVETLNTFYKQDKADVIGKVNAIRQVEYFNS